LEKVYIYNYILSVIVAKVPTDSETSSWAQSAVSALVKDHLTASIQVVTRRQSLLSRPSKTIPRVLVLWICVLGSESMLLERIYAARLPYISVCLRTRQDPIVYIYSSTCVFRVQNLGRIGGKTWRKVGGKIGERWGKTWGRLEKRGDDWRDVGKIGGKLWGKTWRRLEREVGNIGERSLRRGWL